MANILKTEKKVAVISMLCEGSSIRAIERITGIHGDTIGRLALRVGGACKKIMDEKMRGLTCKQIEVDEIWGFIGAKQKNAKRSGAYGDVWTFIALDADTKLIPSFNVGKRDSYHCTCCNGESKRRGFYRNKNFNVQRFECLKCGTSFSDKQPLDNLRVDFKQACQVANLLCEGMGIRAISRLTGLHQQTVLNVLARAGSKASRFLEATVKNVQVESVQADEMFCYVGCKDRMNVTRDPFKGSQYLFMAIDSKSKFIIAHAIGQRSARNTEALLNDLRQRVSGRFQLTTDGFDAYKVAVPRMIGKDVDFAQEVKRYAIAKDGTEPERRYSPSRCIGTRIHIRRGNPNPDLISTSYMERTNLTVRMFNRRFTRLTLGYSKKFEYLIHSINLMVFYYNFIWTHSAHGKTPAMEAGLASNQMTFEDMLTAPEA